MCSRESKRALHILKRESPFIASLPSEFSTLSIDRGIIPSDTRTIPATIAVERTQTCVEDHRQHETKAVSHQHTFEGKTHRRRLGTDRFHDHICQVHPPGLPQRDHTGRGDRIKDPKRGGSAHEPAERTRCHVSYPVGQGETNLCQCESCLRGRFHTIRDGGENTRKQKKAPRTQSCYRVR